MRLNKNDVFKLLAFALLYLIGGCGSSSSSSNQAEFIPPFVDPNGGPVLKLDIGSDTSSKKSKINAFLKGNTQSVEAYTTSGNLIGGAIKVLDGLWQIQLPNNSPVILKAIINNNSEGKIRLELLLANPATNTYEINEKTTITVAIAYLASYLESVEFENEQDYALLSANALALLNDIKSNNFLKNKLNTISTSASPTVAVDQAALFVKELYAFTSLSDVIKNRIRDIESGTIRTDITGIATSQFEVNGSLDLVLITNLLDISQFNLFVNNVNTALLTAEISNGNIKLTSKSDITINQEVSFPLTNNDINEIQSFFGSTTNEVPTITSVASKIGVLNTLYSYTIITHDNDGDAVTISIKTAPTWLTLANNILSGTPTATGDFNVIIEARDNINSLPDQEVYTLSVTATASANAAPKIISAPSTTVTVGDSYSYTIFATDADQDTLAYSTSTLPSWLSFDVSTNELTGSPLAINIGDHSVQLDVTDGKNVSSDIFKITVNPAVVNGPPVFDNSGDQTAHQDINFTLNFSATDPDNDTVTLGSKQLPAWLTFSATTGLLSGTPAFSDAGATTIILTASDGINSPATELTFIITVNTIPNFTSTPIETATVGISYVYNVVATDNDGDAVFISPLTIPAWLTYASTGSVLSGSPTEGDIGVHEIELSVTDNKSVSTNTQKFQVFVLSDIIKGTVDNTDVTDGQIVKFGNNDIEIEIAPRDANNTSLVLNILLDGVEQTLTNNSFTLTPSNDSYSLVFKSTDTSQLEKTITVTLEQDKDHLLDITFSGETAITGGYRKVPGAITFSADFQGLVSDTIISRTIQLDDVPQSLNSNNQYIMDPTETTSGDHKIKATISYTDSTGTTQTSSKTIDFNLIENNQPTQIVKVGDLQITSDISLVLHSGTTVTVTTTEHNDLDSDTITKGLYINDVLNSDLTQYTVDINNTETLKIKTYLKDPFQESPAFTLTFTSALVNGGIPVTLSATGVLLTNSTTYRDKVNGQASIATITANLGTDPEGDALSSIQWYVNSTLLSGQTSTTLLLDLSTYGGTTINVEAKVIDDFASSPTTTNASINLSVDLDSLPTFTSATLDAANLVLAADISVDHSSNTNKVYKPVASDPEGDEFSFQYTLSSSSTSGSEYPIPFDTLDNSTFVANIIQFNQKVATDSHNVTADNIVPTPIIIGNASHIDLNGNYTMIVKPGIDIEGDKLTTLVTMETFNTPSTVTLAGVVVDNEIHYTINLTSEGATTPIFRAKNTDDNSSPATITTTHSVSVAESPAPSNIKAVRGDTTVTLTWDSVNSASSYNIYYGNVSGITTGSTKVANVSSPTTISSLTNGVTYYFRVSANHTSDEGPLSSADTPMTPHAPGDTFTMTINSQNFIFKFIPAGTFTMGSANTEVGHEIIEAPSHSVILTKEFWMLETEVNQAQWNALITNTHATISGSPSNFTGSTLPVEQVTWEDISGTDGFLSLYHTATSAVAGTYKLPTEAQWEYAYRAGTTTSYHWADNASITTYAWYSGNASTTTNPVGTKTANAWGLKDMAGNISEWCSDKAPSAYISSTVTDPTGPTTSNERIYRGGSWFDDANHCRAAQRFQASKDIKGTNIGFRFIKVPLATE